MSSNPISEIRLRIDAIKELYYTKCSVFTVSPNQAFLRLLDDCITNQNLPRKIVIRGNDPENFNSRLTSSDFIALVYTLTEVEGLDLEQLEIINHRLNDPHGGGPFVNLLTTFPNSLTHLSFAHNDLCTSALPLTDALRGCQLRSLDISHNPLGPTFGIQLVPSLRIMDTLEYIDLSHTQQNEASLVSLIDVLLHSPNLKVLKMDDPEWMRDKMAVVYRLGLLLEKAKNLTHVSLKNWKLNDDEVEHLAFSLQKSSVTHLDLSKNRLGEIGFRNMHGKWPEKLHTLILHTNRINDRSIAYLPLNVPELDIANNTRITKIGTTMLTMRIDSEPNNLAVLTLWGAEFVPKSAFALRDSQNRNGFECDIYVCEDGSVALQSAPSIHL
ncbi:hypothetical protein PCE1_001744 [Barthelona sp. PCE]